MSENRTCACVGMCMLKWGRWGWGQRSPSIILSAILYLSLSYHTAVTLNLYNSSSSFLSKKHCRIDGEGILCEVSIWQQRRDRRHWGCGNAMNCVRRIEGGQRVKQAEKVVPRTTSAPQISELSAYQKESVFHTAPSAFPFLSCFLNFSLSDPDLFNLELQGKIKWNRTHVVFIIWTEQSGFDLRL